MWTTIKNWLCGNMGTAGDYSYQAMHYITLLVVAAVAGVLLVLTLRWRRDADRCRKLLYSVAVFLFSSSVTKSVKRELLLPLEM